MQLFIHAGSDYVGIADKTNIVRLPRNDIEQAFPRYMVTYMKNTPPSEIYLLQGPGSFTNIRVVCLTLTMLQSIHSIDCAMYTLHKMQFYHQLYQQSCIPRYGYVYIGQRKNRRYVDLADQTYKLEPIHQHDAAVYDREKKADFFVDYIHDTESIGMDGLSADTRKIYQSNMLNYTVENQQICCVYNTHSSPIHSIRICDRGSPVEILTAWYGIQPNITLPTPVKK